MASLPGRADEEPFLSNLQLLRFLAAAMVLVHHLQIEVTTKLGGTSLIDPTGVEWSIGVDVFFVVSGFIMYFLTHGRFGVPGQAAEFVKRRFMRVAPLYWLFTSLMIASIALAGGAVAHSDLSPARIVSSYLFVPWPRAGGDVYPVLGLGWTLNYEVEFYLAYAAALLLPARIGLPLLLGAFGLAAAFGRFLPADQLALRFWTDPIILEFLFGIGLAWTYLRGVKLALAWRTLLVASGLILSAAFTARGLVDHVDRSLWGGLPAILIAMGVCLGRQAPVNGLLMRGLIVCGNASYALYLSHMFSLRLLTTLWRRLGLDQPVAYVVVGFVLSTGVSVAVYLLMEKPTLAWLRRVTRRPAAA